MTLPPDVRDAIVAHARDAAPAECCGMLVGSPGAITSAVRARNLSDRPASRFLVDPADHIRARRDARAAGLDVVGFYHSHPHSAAVPSAADLADASYPDCLYVIVGLTAEGEDVRLYRFTGDGFDLQVAEAGTHLDHHGG